AVRASQPASKLNKKTGRARGMANMNSSLFGRECKAERNGCQCARVLVDTPYDCGYNRGTVNRGGVTQNFVSKVVCRWVYLARRAGRHCRRERCTIFAIRSLERPSKRRSVCPMARYPALYILLLRPSAIFKT